MPNATTTPAQPITLTRRKRTATDLICSTTTLADRIAAFHAGWQLDRSAILAAKAAQIPYRTAKGFAPLNANMTTSGDANHKLALASIPSIGFTGASHVMRYSDGKLANACPDAGQCVAVCVLNRGHGRYRSVGLAREWRSDFLGTDPLAALTLIGAELRRYVNRKGAVAWRGNVNTDLDWHTILGDTMATLPGVTSYDYTKRVDVLNGAPTGTNHIAYSYSETSDAAAVNAFVEHGGNAAVVTDRRAGDPIVQWHPTLRVVDADTSDLWMLAADGVIGDLSFKRDGIDIPDALAFVQRVGYAGPATSDLIWHAAIG